MRTALQELILSEFSLPGCRYKVDTDNGVVYGKRNDGTVVPLKQNNGEVLIYLKKKPFHIKVHQLIFLMNNGKYNPDSDIIHIDKEKRNNRASNLKEVPAKVQYNSEKVHRNDIVDTIIKMYNAGITAKEIAERLLINYQRVTRAINNYKAKKSPRKFRRKLDSKYLDIAMFKNAYI
jgi:hypothetical protein